MKKIMFDNPYAVIEYRPDIWKEDIIFFVCITKQEYKNLINNLKLEKTGIVTTTYKRDYK